MRSAGPAIWPAKTAPTKAKAKAIRMRGDNQLFTVSACFNSARDAENLF
jgi:hypothetical protein